MPPKKQPTRTAGLLHFFNKQQQERLQKTDQKDDDSCQIVFDAKIEPRSSAAVPKTPETPKNSTKWSETLEKNATTSGSPPAGRDWLNPFPVQVGSARKRSENTRKDELLSNGFDNVHGNGIFYPIDEPIRSFELNLMKSAASRNCCIAVPASSPSTSSRVCAVTVYNFLKWFPSCRVLIVSSSDSWMLSLQQLGLEPEITKLTTMSQFKSMKTAIGRVLLCTSPQCALKVVESSEARLFLKEIRLVVMDLKANECCTKYKPILNALTVKETFFRCVVLTTATSNASRRTASITKRQIMITNLQLSDWIEPSETDFSFRCENIPAGIEVKTWKTQDSSEKLLEVIQNYEDFCRNPIEVMFQESIIPSKTLRKLLWCCWKTIKLTAQSPQIREKLELSELMVTTYKTLIIDGVVAARSFVKKHLEDPKLRETTQKIMSIFGGFSEFPAKFHLLANAIEAFLKLDNHVRGVVLCRDPDQAAEIQNFLEFQISVKSTNFMRIVEDGVPSGRGLWQISRISTAFHDKKSPKILIIPMKIRDFVGFSDQLPVNELTFVASLSRESLFNFKRFNGAYLLIVNDPIEKLRKEDGRLIVDDGKFGQKDSKNVKIGAVGRYDFKFESSRLRLDSTHFPIRFFYPCKTVGNSSIANSKWAKSQIEFSPTENSELSSRMKNLEFCRFHRRKRPLCVTQSDEDPKGMKALIVQEMDEEQLIWNQDIQYLGDIKSSKMSHRITKYLKCGKLEWSMGGDNRRYQYINEISNEQRLLHLDRLLQSLDSQFSSKMNIFV